MTVDTHTVPPGHAPTDSRSGWRPLLDHAERAVLALRLTLSLAAFCLLLVAVGMRFLLPEERGIAELVAGAAAILVAIPVLVAAWESILHPSLDGVTERLIALATIAAWATGRFHDGGGLADRHDGRPHPGGAQHAGLAGSRAGADPFDAE